MKSINQQIQEYNSYKNNNSVNIIKRYDIINSFIKKNNYINYLEIGVNNGLNIRKIIAEHKDGVDSGREGVFAPETNYRVTSDEFFDLIKDHDIKYDIIFVDGLHHDYQVYKDIVNSLNHITSNGTIICHDINPLWEITQRNEAFPGCGCWNGSCWKAWVKLKAERNDLEMYVVDTDHGCGVIKRGKQKLIKLPTDAFNLDFDYLDYNRKELLNLISVEEFFKKIND